VDHFKGGRPRVLERWCPPFSGYHLIDAKIKLAM
jgi:hypothetical protein